MISIPVGFDAVQLLSDFIFFASPFVAISVIFAGYYVFKRAVECL